MRETGIVKWFDANVGFGCIRRSNGEQILVNCLDVEGFGQDLQAGEQVTFDVIWCSEGPHALRVVRAGREGPMVQEYLLPS